MNIRSIARIVSTLHKVNGLKLNVLFSVVFRLENEHRLLDRSAQNFELKKPAQTARSDIIIHQPTGQAVDQLPRDRLHTARF